MVVLDHEVSMVMMSRPDGPPGQNRCEYCNRPPHAGHGPKCPLNGGRTTRSEQAYNAFGGDTPF